MEKEKNKKEENKIVEKEEKDTKKVKIEKTETSIGIEISADAVKDDSVKRAKLVLGRAQH